MPPPCGGCGKQKAHNAAKAQRLVLVAPSKRCIVHDTHFINVCNGCAADAKAAG